MRALATAQPAPPPHHPLARPATAWVLLAITVLTGIAFGVIFYSPITPPALYQAGGGISGFFVFPFASFSIVGVLIATRRPANPIGWLCLGASALLGIGSLSALTGSLLFNANNGLGGYVLLLSALWNAPGGGELALLLLLLLVFPDGHLPSARWRWLMYAVAGVASTGLILIVVNATPGVLGIASQQQQGITLPVSILAIPGSAGVVNTLSNAWNVVGDALGAVVLVSIFLRLRGADADRRHQIKWVAFAAVLLLLVIVGISALPFSQQADPGPVVTAIVGTLVTIAGLAVPVAFGVAVFKYRLYDIDVIISRTLVYGALAVFITAVYVGIAVGIGALIGGGGKPDLGLSILATAIVAIGFQPVRERLQRVANRLVYGTRATPYEVLSEFSGRVAESYAAEDVLPRMARVLQEGTGAQSAVVWLRSEDQMRPAASHPQSVDGLGPLRMTGNVLPNIPADRAVAVEHQGELLGALSVTKRRGESLTPLEAKLLDDLAHQAGLVIKNVGLTSQLLQRLEELRTSRQRLVQAQDEERRRLERNLHDGAQQHLVALKVKLGLVETLSAKDPAKANAMLEQLKSDTDDALETLRDLARGIYPPLLADKGLGTALAAHARKATVPVTVEADGIGRYSPDVEATVYFCVLEALQNVQKYAGASRAIVRLRKEAGMLRFVVEDDGHGFDPSTAKKGAGLTNMADRLDAAGGSLDVASNPGGGTKVRGTLPLQVLVPA
jgi:signal transduction histidine kinase